MSMVINHDQKYLFIEVPHTGSTAISRELRSQYGGESILHKHATYSHFLQIATPAEKRYFVFAGIRNPLDVAVTKYFKYKTNHRELYTTAERRVENGGSVSWSQRRRFHFTQQADGDFAAYFRKYHQLPFNDSVCVDARTHANFLIRFEQLQEDFAEVLRRLNIPQVRPLPQVNRTNDKKTDFLTYYTPEIIPQAKRVFGPVMAEWGYRLPPAWGDSAPSWSDRWSYQLSNLVRKFYWQLKWQPTFYGRLLRTLK